MVTPTGLDRLTRRLNLIGTALVGAAFVAFVWAVGFTRGVEGLIEGLVIAGVGLFIPGIAAFWVSWIIGTSTSDDAIVEAPPPSTVRERFAMRIGSYAIAAACVAIAAGVRAQLSPYLGHIAPFATFFLAVTVAAWVGGMGPAVLASALSVVVVWVIFLNIRDPGVDTTGELVGTGLFLAVALAIAGITSALRLTQRRAASLRERIDAEHAAMAEAEERFRTLANRSQVLLRVTDAAGNTTFASESLIAYTGAILEGESAADAWLSAVHPDDRARYRSRIGKAIEAREPYTLEYRLKRADDTFVRHRESGTPRLLANGTFAGYVGDIVDVADASRGTRPAAWPASEPPSAERGTVE